MKKIKLFFIFLIILIFSFSWSFQNLGVSKEKESKNHNYPPGIRHIKLLNEGQPYRYQGPLYAPGQVLVKFSPSLSNQRIEATIATYNSKEIRRIPRIDVYQLQVPEEVEVMEMVSLLNQNRDVEYAEPNYVAHIAVTPNDPWFKYQYALYNSGQSIGVPGSPQEKPRADIKATEAWEETKGDEEVIIAVIDTGVDLLHPDIYEKILHSGRDFVNDDFDATDDNYHGTLVAGIAAADTNNYEGMAGVAWNCKILPIKVLDADGLGYFDDVIEGIIWAADNGANVINLSLGGEVGGQSMEEAVKYAYEKDIVIAVAAGNEGAAVLYPAAYDAYCLAVAATNYNDERVTLLNSGGIWESNYGPEVDIAAPGEAILSMVPTWFWGPGSFPYAYTGGTSLSTPHVAGLAALIKSIKPWLSARDIMNIIRFSADDVNSPQNPGRDEFLGYGRINMEKALVPIIITSSK